MGNRSTIKTKPCLLCSRANIFFWLKLKEKLSCSCRWYCKNINRSQAELLLQQKVTLLIHRVNDICKDLSVTASSISTVKSKSAQHAVRAGDLKQRDGFLGRLYSADCPPFPEFLVVPANSV